MFCCPANIRRLRCGDRLGAKGADSNFCYEGKVACRVGRAVSVCRSGRQLSAVFDELFKQGGPIVALSYVGGILLLTVSRGTPKLSMESTTALCWGMGHQADLEKLRFSHPGDDL